MKFARLATWIFFGLVCAFDIVHAQTASPASPTAPAPQAGWSLTDAAMGTLLQQADGLIRGGKLADAYKLLEPKEARLLGRNGL